MAQYTVHHTCGHTVVVNLIGPGEERTRRLDQMSSNDCTSCFCSASAAFAAKQTASLALPDLRGTAKQIVWATTIRARIIAETEDIIARFTHDHVLIPPEYVAAFAALKAQASAAFWIDARDRNVRSLVRTLVNGAAQ